MAAVVPAAAEALPGPDGLLAVVPMQEPAETVAVDTQVAETLPESVLPSWIVSPCFVYPRVKAFVLPPMAVGVTPTVSVPVSAQPDGSSMEPREPENVTVKLSTHLAISAQPVPVPAAASEVRVHVSAAPSARAAAAMMAAKSFMVVLMKRSKEVDARFRFTLGPLGLGWFGMF